MSAEENDLEENDLEKNEMGKKCSTFWKAPFTTTSYLIFSAIIIFVGIVNIWTMYDFPPYCASYKTQKAENMYNMVSICVITVGAIFVLGGMISFLWNLLVHINPQAYTNQNNLKIVITGILLLALFFATAVESTITISLISASIRCNELIATPVIFIVLWGNALIFSFVAWIGGVILFLCAALAILIISLPFVLCYYIIKEDVNKK